MTPFYVAFASLWLISFATANSQSRRATLTTTVLAIVILWVLLAFRAPQVGTDVNAYLAGLGLARGMEPLSGERILNFEPGFSAYLAALANWGASEQMFLAITAALTLIPVAVTVYRFSPMPVMSLFFYATLGCYAFAFTGLRQAWAVALCFYALGTIVDRRLFRFSCIVGAASLLHLSALTFFPAYWLYRVRAHRLTLPVGLLGLAVVFLLREPIFSVLYGIYRTDEVTIEATGAFSLFIALALAWTGAIALDPGSKEPKEHPGILVGTRNFLYAATAFQALASVSFLVGRAGQYYLIFTALLIPHLIARQEHLGARSALWIGTATASLTYFVLLSPSFEIVPFVWAKGT